MNVRITEIGILTVNDIQTMQDTYSTQELHDIFENYPKSVFCVQTADGWRCFHSDVAGMVFSKIPSNKYPSIIPIIRGYIDDINQLSDIRIGNRLRFHPIFVDKNSLVTFMFFACSNNHANSYSTNVAPSDIFVNYILSNTAKEIGFEKTRQ